MCRCDILFGVLGVLISDQKTEERTQFLFKRLSVCLMPSFCCESCNDVLSKPRIAKHRTQCDASAFSCIDCNRTFVGSQVDAHTSCVTEAEKYKHNAYFNATPKNAASKRPANNPPPPPPTAPPTAAAAAVAVVASSVTPETVSAKRRRTDDDEAPVANEPVVTAAAAGDRDDDDDADADDTTGGDFAAVLDEMQEFKWKKSISALVKQQQSSMPLDALADALIANFYAQFKPKLVQVIKAKVRASKKLKFERAADGSITVVKKA
jgi:hypothetical protein